MHGGHASRRRRHHGRCAAAATFPSQPAPAHCFGSRGLKVLQKVVRYGTVTVRSYLS